MLGPLQAGELRQKLRVMEGVLMTLTAAEARELRKEVQRARERTEGIPADVRTPPQP